MAKTAGVIEFGARDCLRCLPLWICLQNLGSEGIAHHIASAVELVCQKVIYHPRTSVKDILMIAKSCFTSYILQCCNYLSCSSKYKLSAVVYGFVNNNSMNSFYLKL